MALYKYGSPSKADPSVPPGSTEFDILKASHKFLRDEDEKAKDLNWNEQVAKKYYSSLYREFAVCDLKHYKSGNFCIRWRTEDEVVTGAGETTCGNTRCPLHEARYVEDFHPSLKTLELPFSYIEHGESQFALVKVVLCEKCIKKLMWKRHQEKKSQEIVGLKEQAAGTTEDQGDPSNAEASLNLSESSPSRPSPERVSKKRGTKNRERHDGDRSRRRSSRSRSPLRLKGE